MDISKTIRDAARVQATFKEAGDQLITLKGCSIIFPKKYEDKQLAYIGEDISLVGIFATFIDDVIYSVSTVPSKFTLGECLIDVIKIDEEEYYKLTYSPGAVVIKNVNALKIKVFCYNIVNYFIDYGKMPWFLNYLDAAELCRDIKKFCNIELSIGQVCFDILVSRIARSDANIREQYRLGIKTEASLFKRPTFIPVMEKSLMTSSVLARFTGGELKRSIRESLIDDKATGEPLEELYKL